MNRSCSAFRFSAEKLYEETGELYFWTFTFREVPESDEWALGAWKKFCERGKRDWSKIHGLRVIELHKLHGMHFHVLLNKRFPIERVFNLAWPLGFGRIEVHRVEEWEGGFKGLIDYLSAYLTKSYASTHWIGRRRRWGTLGGFQGTRCKDLEYDTPFHRNKRLLFGDAQVDWKEIAFLRGLSNFGEFADWPQSVQEKWMAFNRANHKPDLRRREAFSRYM